MSPEPSVQGTSSNKNTQTSGQTSKHKASRFRNTIDETSQRSLALREFKFSSKPNTLQPSRQFHKVTTCPISNHNLFFQNICDVASARKC